jgi:uncharacterized membrane protein
MDQALFVVTLVSALGCGLIAGAFFAFSSFVMKSLARLPAEQGIAAMQSINVVVINPVFLGVFVGTALTCGLLAISTAWRWNAAGTGYLLAGGALYVLGCFVVTMAFNVPRNNILAAIDPKSADAAKLWADYVSGWTAWNHVRTVGALLAAAALIAALWRMRAAAA